MKLPLLLLAVVSTGLLTQCATPPPGPSGPGFIPPPTVLMPVAANAREGQYAPRVEDTLRRAGLEPVYRGPADMRLDFSILEGPVNVDTAISLQDRGRLVAQGMARASGPPLMNRHRVVEDSFFQALGMFESQLLRTRPFPHTRPFPQPGSF